MSSLKRKDLLDIQSLSVEEILLICRSAKYFKDIFTRSVKSVPILRGKTVCTLFYEPSTRTRLSFELAAKRLSSDLINFSVSTSSVVKGESLIDTVHTLEAMKVDYIVMRHAASMAPHFLSRNIKASVINAGDGFHAHPTQALLDTYSIMEKRGSLEGLHIGIIGDIKHSRVARSDIEAFKKLGARVTLCGPPTLVPDVFHLYGVDISYNLDDILPELDVINLLRIQKERQKGSLFPSLREYHRQFALTEERFRRCRENIIVMHPGPVNRGIEIDNSVVESSRTIINEQVTNGVAVRMALFYLLAGGAPLEEMNEERGGIENSN
ncbi:MAG TPA: aspartate carbamoyltransferase catalytic subunit [Spirochaetota bacterium]|nr:aspartate carbamoyltransferase catalytic subunit [Spirochaetota bacterium]HOD13229.1 aspartate carbamoyltransferase catalytic subunit [Spirochaetota bacterium]HPG48963.1 aspartate carbamoyltransferase catalytic subunit [Spirochaetota bacterium]HPN10472.1 aspartate carbamoyltransferase catalytic subunit [Spirochaetota bacterium]HQL80652.1 aspartate carbamoyltransferase catalytic subunit [Spirochaetota bacterium]